MKTTQKEAILKKIQEDIEGYLYSEVTFDTDLRLSVTMDTISQALDTYAESVKEEELNERNKTHE